MSQHIVVKFIHSSELEFEVSCLDPYLFDNSSDWFVNSMGKKKTLWNSTYRVTWKKTVSHFPGVEIPQP